MGKEFRRSSQGDDEDKGKAPPPEDETRYGLQTFAAGDAQAKKETTEEERMLKYVEERIAPQKPSEPSRDADSGPIHLAKVRHFTSHRSFSFSR